MNILIYCQHVLGIGHLFRTLAVARELREHRVTLVLGGPEADFPIPRHVRVERLPGLRMDKRFSGLLPVEADRDLDEVKEERIKKLLSLARELRPDVLLIELFPFGRNGFAFELLPLLEGMRNGSLPGARVACSLRDILVEKPDQVKFEQRALSRLNRLFDALLIHSDPDVLSLETTFSRTADITIPVVYTGYVCERSAPGSGILLRQELGLDKGEKLVVVSAGGGSVGRRLLEAAVRAHRLLDEPVFMQVFTGPYLDEDAYHALVRVSGPSLRIARFSDSFPAWLDAADLSLSMGGYNTTLNTLAAGTPALILPFDQNREQRLRLEKLSGRAAIGVLEEEDLAPETLARRITRFLHKEKKIPALRLDGSQYTARWLSQWGNGGREP
ncbi:MAG: glycosyltransferase [Desulfobulbaceae bacterium]